MEPFFPMPQPGYEFLTRLEIESGKRFPLGVTSRGRRAIDFLVGGRFDGPRLKGRLIDGADHQLQFDDGTIPEVRIGLKTDDGAAIAMTYTGVVWAPPAVMARFRAREPVDPSEYYLRTQIRLECGAPQYAWLNRCICVGVGQPAQFPSGNHGIWYDIHKVV